MTKISSFKKMMMFLMFINVSVMLSACTNSEEVFRDKELGIYDPFEKYNRQSLRANNALDKAVLEPIAKGYRKVTPKAARIITRNFLTNLNSPIDIGNQILQGDAKGAANASARMVINTLAGFGGILDLAEQGGIPREPEDFGQTLAVWGVGNGPYIMLPLMGPSNLRDVSGMVVDRMADPLSNYLFNINEGHLQYTRTGVTILSKREELIEVIDDLRQNSFDSYAAIRSAYHQQRKALINDQEGGFEAEIPEYDDF
jgi:phospholipid-binding lipoprotein MlaA